MRNIPNFWSIMTCQKKKPIDRGRLRQWTLWWYFTGKFSPAKQLKSNHCYYSLAASRPITRTRTVNITHTKMKCITSHFIMMLNSTSVATTSNGNPTNWLTHSQLVLAFSNLLILLNFISDTTKKFLCPTIKKSKRGCWFSDTFYQLDPLLCKRNRLRSHNFAKFRNDIQDLHCPKIEKSLRYPLCIY